MPYDAHCRVDDEGVSGGFYRLGDRGEDFTEPLGGSKRAAFTACVWHECSVPLFCTANRRAPLEEQRTLRTTSDVPQGIPDHPARRLGIGATVGKDAGRILLHEQPRPVRPRPG